MEVGEHTLLNGEERGRVGRGQRGEEAVVKSETREGIGWWREEEEVEMG